MEDVSAVSLVVMSNTAQVRCKEGIRHTFDLKGSFINRKVKVNHKIKATTCLKDLNMKDLIETITKTGKNNKMQLGRNKTF